MQIRYCPSCQAIAEPTWAECLFCHHDFTAAPPPEPAPAPAPTLAAAGPAGRRPSRPPRDRRRLLVIGGVVALAGVLAAAAVTVVRGSGPGHPAAWDPHVEGLAHFVAEARGFDFRHPVYVDYLSDEDFADALAGGDAELTEEERAEVEREVAVYRGLGLLHGELPVSEDAGPVVGFYDPRTERISVRGTDLTPDVKVTLVHELTHALQDQQFDIDREGAYGLSTRDAAFRTVLEGDARLVEMEYVASLGREETDALLDATNEVSARMAKEAIRSDFDQVPPILFAELEAPYVLGPVFLNLVMTARSFSRDQLVELPPTSEQQIVDPFAYLDRTDPVATPPPLPPETAAVLDEGDFGALRMYLVLSERIDPHTALGVLDDWAGDAYVVYDDGAGRICTELAVATRGQNAAARTLEAFTAWAREMPQGTASANRQEHVVELASCDPGPRGGRGNGGSATALVLPAVRNYLATGLLEAGLSRAEARCVAGEVIGSYSVAELADPDSPTLTPTELERRVGGGRMACAGVTAAG